MTVKNFVTRVKLMVRYNNSWFKNENNLQNLYRIHVADRWDIETTTEQTVLVMPDAVAEEIHILVHLALGTMIMPLPVINDREHSHMIILVDCTTAHIIGPNVAKIGRFNQGGRYSQGPRNYNNNYRGNGGPGY
jgi:hypothetical protein